MSVRTFFRCIKLRLSFWGCLIRKKTAELQLSFHHQHVNRRQTFFLLGRYKTAMWLDYRIDTRTRVPTKSKNKRNSNLSWRQAVASQLWQTIIELQLKQKNASQDRVIRIANCKIVHHAKVMVALGLLRKVCHSWISWDCKCKFSKTSNKSSPAKLFNLQLSCSNFCLSILIPHAGFIATFFKRTYLNVLRVNSTQTEAEEKTFSFSFFLALPSSYYARLEWSFHSSLYVLHF